MLVCFEKEPYIALVSRKKKPQTNYAKQCLYPTFLLLPNFRIIIQPYRYLTLKTDPF